MNESNKEIVILIPVYKPNIELVKLVEKLSEDDNIQILVIDDGNEEKEYINRAKKYCEIIEHTYNQGKGCSLKTGFKYINENYKNIIGVICADADGQHTIEDIEKIKAKLIKNPNNVVLGCRNFRKKGIPIKNKFGNIIINFIFRLKTKMNILDTQTGLRAIPFRLLKDISKISGERYEYELNELMFLVKKADIIQIEIETVYQKNIKSSFKRIKDSWRILKSIIFN